MRPLRLRVLDPAAIFTPRAVRRTGVPAVPRFVRVERSPADGGASATDGSLDPSHSNAFRNVGANKTENAGKRTNDRKVI